MATRPAARRAVKKPSSVVLKGLPVLWARQGEGQAIGLHVDEDEVWAGWESGDVVVFDHAGKLQRRWKLPAGVDALVADDAWRYAGGNDGNVYDLTGRAPRVAYEVQGGARIHWVEVYRGNLCASDAKGCLTVIDPDGKLLFRYPQKGGSQGWMVRADGTGVYLGNSHGVTKVSWQGKKLWHTKTAWVGFGWQEADRVYAFVAASTQGKEAAVVSLDKETGKLMARGSCWSTQPHYSSNSAAACASGRGGEVIYGGTCDTLFAFDAKGALQWEASTRKVGATCSMAYHRMPSGQERLYVVTHKGQLACLDVSDGAVAKARKTEGKASRATRLKAVAVTERQVEEVKHAGKGVVVECVKDGGKVRVRVVSPGYHQDWFCQFPRDIREVGARYVVDEVREASQGGFYRVLGDIKRLRG
jgi:outer membrane protein assembly factor BamB